MSLSALLLLFFAYAFLGWVLEVAAYSIAKQNFINRGFLHGPLLPSVGILTLIMLALLDPLKNDLGFLFLASVAVSGVLQAVSGFLLEQVTHTVWWDYSGKKFSAGKYVCLQSALVFGVLVFFVVLFLNPLLVWVLRRLPQVLMDVVAIVLSVLLAADLATATVAARRTAKGFRHVQETAEKLGKTSQTMEEVISKNVASRLEQLERSRLAKAYPDLVRWAFPPSDREIVFASGLNFFKLFWIFLISAFLGDLIETGFCLVTAGELMSRSSVLYGPFSVVWGLGAVLLTITLYGLAKRSDGIVFLCGTVIGGVYEFLCSVFTEQFFGTIFWDYSKLPFNLGGRINLLYCFFWGILSVVWIKKLYPSLSRLVEKLPNHLGKILSSVLVVLMLLDAGVSAAALSRAAARENGKPAAGWVDTFLDTHYPDSRIQQVYPNMKFVDS